MELIMFVGIPASGKSTRSAAYRKQGYLILSSDQIRETLMEGRTLASLTDKEKSRVHSQVFELIRNRAREALKQGQSVVVDATNLNRKRRMAFLDQFKRFDCKKKCVLFITPAEICMARNRLRKGSACVPEEGMYHMLCSFECPIEQEGWDEIIPAADSSPYRFPFDAIRNFDQDNPHHSLTLDAHMEAAAQLLKEQGASDMLVRVGKYHDIGKLYTKRYATTRGIPTKHAHYLGHDSYGAYLYLTEMCCGKELSREAFSQILYETNLINCHMKPLTSWRWKEDAEEKDRQFFGEAFMSDLKALHRADREAH